MAQGHGRGPGDGRLWPLGAPCDTCSVKSLWLLAVLLVTVYALCSADG
jgi:hypothetical protein